MQYQQQKKALYLILMTTMLTSVYAEDESTLELSDIEIVGATPLHGIGLAADKIAANIQSATAEEIENSQSLDITDFMNKTLGSVSINAAQNNPFQPDLQFRGFTASPLVGVAQGLSVYQDGVRVNEPFGDTVNFELIPESAIASINLIPGSNPLFGLNTLGGAISILTKNGFTDKGHSIEAYTGSFGRHSVTLESGDKRGNFAYFVTGAYTEEEGWRDESPSQVEQLFAKLSYKNDFSTLDLALTAVDSDLNGNGAAPIELSKSDREAVFTYPDNTQNELWMLSLNGSHWLTNTVLLSANSYYRNNDRETFNGDGAELEIDNGFLVEEEGDGIDPEDRIEDINGNDITEAALGNPDNNLALNNTSTTEQDGYGVSFQVTLTNDLLDQENQLIIGVSYDKADMNYNARSEVAVFKDDRGTIGTGVVINESVVDGKIDSDSLGIFFTDTLSITDQLALTVSARYNLTHIDIAGTSEGGDTNLNESGDTHTYQRINPAVGLAYAVNDDLGVYGSYSESSRAPTASELTCSNKEKPCALPNSFLSDPPLDQVVAKTWEAGLRGQFNAIIWTAGMFRTVNKDDIIFIPVDEGVPGNISNGFFDNVGETKRQGVELGLNGILVENKLSWFANYSYVDATFEDRFSVFNENNPAGEDTAVGKGDSIPGIPKHNVKLGADYAFTPALSLGFDASYHSSQYYRGDEANNNSRISDYQVVNLHARYKLNKHIEFFAKVDNLFDNEYETFGLYGEPDEAPGLDTLDDPRFVGAGPPRAGWIGIKIAL
ncbi:MAG: TonB-dependent receptor [Methylococcales symbiont of Iophon sp. n. MRB-2018]|nr:MAG: TonB-dependent receptor [Methylococcales symbiont of Iophon sp. n. MRB-2018]KAF3979051.1 MAG: TonB-dependent receptor [Methylococcales symbiont of Iophon sp. n. MRB-2018]